MSRSHNKQNKNPSRRERRPFHHQSRLKWNEVVNIYNIHHSLTLASKGKYKRPDVMTVIKHDNFYILNFLQELCEGTYCPREYEHFIITEPKYREVIAAPFPDRVIHQLIVEYIFKPYFVPDLSKNTFACLKGRGVHSAKNHLHEKLARLMEENNNFGYIVKMDIFKFFYSIDREILLNIIKKTVKDERLIQLIDFAIHTDKSGEYNMNRIPGMEDTDASRKGIPIGNVTSQYLANIYLDVLDKYITNELLPSIGMDKDYFLRYMDDFVVLTKNRADARIALDKIRTFAEQKLQLKLNSKSQIIRVHPDTAILFCGYLVSAEGTFMARRNKHSLKKILRVKNAEKFNERFPSWVGHAGHCCDWWQYTGPILKNHPVYKKWLNEHLYQNTPKLIRSLEMNEHSIPVKNVKRKSSPNHQARRRASRRANRQTQYKQLSFWF